jgi:hypothetical protein
MPTFEIQGPNGSIFEAQAPDERTAAAAFRKYAAQQPQSGPWEKYGGQPAQQSGGDPWAEFRVGPDPWADFRLPAEQQGPWTKYGGGGSQAKQRALAVNPTTGEVLHVDDGGKWSAARKAVNPQTGQEVYFDGDAWKPLNVALAKFRHQYPEYNDLSDSDLADRLHSRLYADVPRAEFDRRIGFVKPQPPAQSGGALESFARGAWQGGTLGWGDELSGANAAGRSMLPQSMVNAPMSPLANAALMAAGAGRMLYDRVAGGGPGAADVAYDATANRERAALKASEDQHPYASMGGNIVGGLASTVAGTPAFIGGKALTTGARYLRGAGLGSAVGGVQGVGSANGDLSDRLAGGAIGAIIGAPLGALGEGAGIAVERAVNIWRSSGWLDAAGALTAKGREALTRSGIDPDAATPQITAAVQSVVRRSGNFQAGGRAGIAAEQGLPATRGMLTGDLRDQTIEEAARRGARGTTAQRVMQDFDTTRGAAIAERAEAIGAGFNGGLGSTVDDNAAAIARGVQGEVAARRGAQQAAYNALETSGETVSASALPALRSRVTEQLDSVFMSADDVGLPGTRSAMRAIDSLVDLKGAPAGGNVVGLALSRVEKIRQTLNQLERKAGGSADGVGIGAIRRGFDNWFQNDFADQMGNSFANGLVKAARSETVRVKEALAANDPALRSVMQKINSGEYTPDKIADVILGRTALPGSNLNGTRIVHHLGNVLGRNSEEWGALRQLAWQRLYDPNAAPAVRAKAIEKFAGSSSAAKALYTTEELGTMMRFATAIRQGITDPRANNPSGTAYIGRALRSGVARTTGAALTGAALGSTGGPVGALVGGVAGAGLAAVPRGVNALAAYFATRGNVPTSLAPGLGGFGGGAALTPDGTTTNYLLAR